MDAVAEAPIKAEPKKPLVMQSSFAPMATKVEALKLLEKGVKPAELVEELTKSGAVERAKDAAQAEAEANAEAKEAALYRDFLLSFIRFHNGKIEKLSVSELEDVASHAPLPEVKFNEWCRRVGE